jgi:hypothetical protein
VASFVTFTGAVSLLQPQLEESLDAMDPPASLLIADAFLYWANALAIRLSIPKLSFFGISAFAQVTLRHGSHFGALQSAPKF